MRPACVFVVLAFIALGGDEPRAAEVTVKNDSLTDFGTAVVVSGFTANEKAGAWLTSPCAGFVRAAQIFWRSGSGGSPPELGQAIEISRSGAFPVPGAIAQTIEGPVLSDGVINEFRFLDENNTVPLVVPVNAGETFVVALDFDVAPPAPGPSVVRDVDGCQAGRNTILAELAPGGPTLWFSSCDLGVAGDWVIRAVVDCNAAGANTDLEIAMTADRSSYSPGDVVTYTIVADNAGTTGASGARVVDAFPATLQSPTWTCTPGPGAACALPSGSGNINATIDLPPGTSATFVAQATVASGASGNVVDSATVSVPPGMTESDPGDNIASVVLAPALVFANGFE